MSLRRVQNMQAALNNSIVVEDQWGLPFPLEIFHKIFSLLLGPPGDHPLSSRREVINATHVCHYWRQAGLQYRTLWAYVAVLSKNPRPTFPCIIAEMLRRSSGVPLELFMDLAYENNRITDHVVRMTLEHLSRVRILHIKPTQRYMDFCALFLAMPAPILQVLHIEASFFDAQYQLPASFGDAQLRELTLHNVDAGKWRTAVIRNLTHLIICNDEYSSQAPPPAAKILQILAECPNLIQFDFSTGRFHKPPLTPCSRNENVTLHFLRRLFLEIHSDICIPLLEHLYLPSLAAWSVAVGGFRTEHIQGGLPNLPPTVPCRIVSVKLGYASVSVEADLGRRKDNGAMCERVTYLVDFEAGAISPLQFLTLLFRNTDFSSARRFDMNCESAVSPGNSWATLLSHLPKLRSIVIELGPIPTPVGYNRFQHPVDGVKSFLDYLSATHGGRGDGFEVPICADLSHLELRLKRPGGDLGAIVQRLFHCIVRRELLGVPIMYLGLTNLPLSSAEAEALRSHVDELDLNPASPTSFPWQAWI